jgi:hypothetical protein
VGLAPAQTPVAALVDTLRADPRLGGELVHALRLPPVRPRFAALDPPRLRKIRKACRSSSENSTRPCPVRKSTGVSYKSAARGSTTFSALQASNPKSACSLLARLGSMLGPEYQSPPPPYFKRARGTHSAAAVGVINK